MAQVTTAQIAEARGVSVRTVHRMVNDGELKPASKLPGKTGAYLFNEGAVEQAFRKAAKKGRVHAEVAA